MTTNKQVKKQLETQAINEMQHMGWSAEKLVNIGGNPRIEHTDIDQSTETADMLRANISLEPEVAAKYNQAAKETENHDLKNLFIRMSTHEKYHHKVFSDLLKEEERG
jgi:bacterioferritin